MPQAVSDGALLRISPAGEMYFRNPIVGSASLYHSWPPLFHVKFPQKQTLKPTIAYRNFIEESFQECA